MQVLFGWNDLRYKFNVKKEQIKCCSCCCCCCCCCWDFLPCFTTNAKAAFTFGAPIPCIGWLQRAPSVNTSWAFYLAQPLFLNLLYQFRLYENKLVHMTVISCPVTKVAFQLSVLAGRKELRSGQFKWSGKVQGACVHFSHHSSLNSRTLGDRSKRKLSGSDPRVQPFRPD